MDSSCKAKWSKRSLVLLVFLAIALLLPITFKLIKKEVKKRAQREHRLTVERLVSTKDLKALHWKKPFVGELPDAALSQPFFFLGKGKQCFAFESMDGRYVLKFFKRPSKTRKIKRVSKILASFQLGAQEIPTETATILFYTGQETPFFLPTIRALTKRGDLLSINLHDYPFLLQKKALPLKEGIVRINASESPEAVEKAFSAIFSLYESMTKKGLLDTDGAVIRNQNIGFIGTGDERIAVLLDFGKLSKAKKKQVEKLRQKNFDTLTPLRFWIKKSLPDLKEPLKNSMEQFEIKTKETL